MRIAEAGSGRKVNIVCTCWKEGLLKNVTQGSSPLSYKTALNLPNRTLLYLDSKGLNIRDGSQHQLLLPISSRLLERSPGYLYADLSNQVWLATSDGVYHLRGKDVPVHYLPEVVTSQVLKDRGGNLWMTTNNGIYMLPQEKKRIYILDSSQGLSNDGVKSLASDDRGRLWLGLDKGHINILSKSGPRVSRINLPDKSRFNAIKQLLFDKKGKTVFFGSDYGLGMISTDIVPYGHVSYLHELNNSRYVLKNFTLSTSRHLAMALSSGVVILTDPVKHPTFASASYKEGENFFNGRSYRAFYDRAQHLWFSNIFGLQELTGQQPSSHHTQHPLLSKRINDMGQLEDGTMVLATDGFGLLFYKNGQITRRITRENGLSNNICKRLFLEKDYLWVVTNNAVNRILLKAGHPVESFDYTNSILDNDVNELYIAKDTAYFATNHGLVFFAKRPFDRTQEIPRAMISAIFSNKHLLSTSTPVVRLRAAENNISFYYSAADFQNNTLIYRYRLKPGDSWSETKNRRLDFFAVEPGAYTFELSARTSNSQWGKSAKVNFVVEAHFWQSVWFILLLILAAGLTFYKLALIVTKQQKDKEQQRLLLRNKILMLEQQALQAMMNPHFVFNVMNSIQHYINTKNTSSANQILTGFARLIRKNLDMCTKSFISVEEELAYLNLYLKLEKTRFGDQLTYSIQIDDRIDQDETMIPSMILQPYIENAIWHGIMPKGAGGKLVIVMKLDTEDNLIISITDDGIGIENSIRDKQEDHVSKGMKLTRDRISLLNQIVQYPIQITINQNGTAGTTISILVPAGR